MSYSEIELSLDTLQQIAALTGEDPYELECRYFGAKEKHEIIVYKIQIWTGRKHDAVHRTEAGARQEVPLQDL